MGQIPPAQPPSPQQQPWVIDKNCVKYHIILITGGNVFVI